jgi:hypothetical protein
MAGFFQNLLTDAARGFVTSDYIRDYQHASKTFVTNSYGYAPKYKFLFHVYFDINKLYIPATDQWPDDQNFGLAVKSVQLPKYTFDLQTLNQYNRKRIVQTKIKYDPVTITMHDDNSNLIKNMWYTYYTYYYKDATQLDSNSNIANAAGDGTKYNLNERNIYSPSITGQDDWGYIGESSDSPATNTAAGLGISKAPFFKAINIYGFNQHNFVLYRLINPMIESFNHDTYDYAQGNGVMEHQMTLNYETVKYFEGAVDGKNPSQFVYGFGEDANYDKTVSPIARPGANETILGQGGLVDAAGGFMSDLSQGNIVGAIQKAGAAATTFKNPQNILRVAKSEALTTVQDALRGTPNRNNQNFFPIEGSTAAKKVVDSINGAYKNVRNQPPPVNGLL